MWAGLAMMTMAVLAPALPQSAPSGRQCRLAKFLDLPVTLTGRREPIATLTINGRPARFIVDSGAFYSSMSSASAAEFGLKETAAPNGFYLKGVGGRANASVVTVKEVGLQGQYVRNVQFLTTGADPGVAGLLGQNFLGIADAEYDLAGGAVRLIQPHDCKNGAQAYWAATKPVSTIEIESKTDARFHIQGTVELNGVKLRAIFDTGAATSLLTLAAAKRAGVTPTSPGVESVGMAHGIGRRMVRSWVGPFDGLKIGGEEIRKIRLRFGDIQDADFDMLIGADFFLSHRLYVSNAEHRIYFTYNGGPVFDLTKGRDDADGTEAGAGEPKTADEFARRGNAKAARNEVAGAVADLTKAIDLSPRSATLLYQRAAIYARMRQPQRSMGDVNQALAIAPDDVDARLLRASLRLRGGDEAAAREDVDHVARSAAPSSDVRLAVGSMYDRLGDPNAAIAQFDLWVASHGEDPRLASGLNGRCWARALANRDLDDALSDCNKALKLRPSTPTYLDSRGLVELRLGQFDEAVADYSAVLAVQPRTAWSLYGRGLAYARLGRKAESEADIKAALAIEPRQTEIARRFGLAPTP